MTYILCVMPTTHDRDYWSQHSAAMKFRDALKRFAFGSRVEAENRCTDFEYRGFDCFIIAQRS